MHTILSRDESWFTVFEWRDKANFHKHLKRSFPSGVCMLEGPCVFCFKWNGPRDALTWKKAGFPCRGLNAGSYFIYQDERMSESPVEILEKALCLHLIWKRGLTSLWHLERNAEFSVTKGDDACLFLNIVRNPRITVPTRNWPFFSCHTSRSVRLVLTSQFRFITRQESWRCWKYMSFQSPSRQTGEYTQGNHRNSRKPRNLPLKERRGLILLHCMQSNSMFPIKQVRRIDLLDGNPMNPQKHTHKSRMTLMSPRECEIVRCIPNQHKMTPNSALLDLVQSTIPHPTRHVACLTLGHSRDSLRYLSQI